MSCLFSNEQLALFMMILKSDNENVQQLFEELASVTKLVHGTEFNEMKTELDIQCEHRRQMAKNAVRNLKRAASINERLRVGRQHRIFGTETQAEHAYAHEAMEIIEEAEAMVMKLMELE